MNFFANLYKKNNDVSSSNYDVDVIVVITVLAFLLGRDLNKNSIL